MVKKNEGIEGKQIRVDISNDDFSPNTNQLQVQLQRSSFDVLGICCPSEVPLVERILKPLAGVEGVSVNVPSRIVTVLHDPLTISSSQIARALNQARLDASIRVRGQLKTGKKWPSPYTIVSGVLLAVSFGSFWFAPLKWVALGAVAAGLPPIMVRSFVALKGRILDINVLMLIAAAGSVGMRDYKEAGSLVFLFTLAEWLESRSSDKARAAIASVMNLAPATAVMEGSNERIPVEQVAVGALVAVKAGDTVPIDGVVVSGKSSVDESSVTGESVPVEKVGGSSVWAGTHNLTGFLCVRTTSLAADSTVSRMAKLVEEAQSQRSPTEHFIQRVAKVYTPGVVLAAGAMAAVAFINKSRQRHWFYLALELLVIACPCALVISTPVATTCALAKAASMGVLIKGSSFLEVLAKLKALAFDKTGTLTEGEFRVVDAQHLDNTLDPATVLRWMGSLESKSNHPMSAAIVAYARQHGAATSLPMAEEVVEDFQMLVGEGICGLISGRRIYVGNCRLANRLGWSLPPPAEQNGDLQVEGASVGYVGLDDRPLLMFHVADSIRPEAAAAVAELGRLGLRIAMVTGDSAAAATRVQTQIEGATKVALRVAAEVKPDEKVAVVRAMRTQFGKTAMIGDGINDAPALAAADVGIAMAVVGSAVAMETADVALMSADLRRLAAAVRLGRRCSRTIRANVAASVLTKALVLGLACAGYVSLWIALLADVGTCLLVTANSMLLLRGSRNRHRLRHCHVDHGPHANANGKCHVNGDCHVDHGPHANAIGKCHVNGGCHVDHEPHANANGNCHVNGDCHVAGNACCRARGQAAC